MTTVQQDVSHRNTSADDDATRESEKTAAEKDAEDTRPVTAKAIDPPPNGGYGWVCVACCFWINAHTWGVNSSYGVFLAYYLDNNYYPGASALEYAFVGGLSISVALAISPIATLTTRSYSTRVTLLTGVFFETLALIGASFARKIWQLFLSQGICFGLGLGFLFVGSVSLNWHGTPIPSSYRRFRLALCRNGLQRSEALPMALLQPGVVLAV